MKNHLDKEVSFFSSCKDVNNPKSINLMDWLRSDKYRKEVDAIRQISDGGMIKILKKKLPVITPSGTFSIRNQIGLINHSGLMQFDIDLHDNQQLKNYEEMKESLSRVKNIAYCGLSVSGKGYWGLVPIRDHSKHTEHFEALKGVFMLLGIKIDPAPGNVASSRFYSYDPNGYFNPSANVFKLLKSRYKTVEKSTRIRTNTPTPITLNSHSKQEKLDQIVAHILVKKIDITITNQAWFEIGSALANEFGERGRDYYHSISQFHPKYTFTETDKKYNYYLKVRYNYRFGTLIHHCRSAIIGVCSTNLKQ